MVNILETSKDFNEVETYLMTISPSIISMKNVDDGTKITVEGYLLFEDVKEDGEKAEIMSIITPERKVYSFQSKTFKRSLLDIFDIMKGNNFTVVKTSGKTKKDRDYINCYLSVE